jgi:hypothetical protein
LVFTTLKTKFNSYAYFHISVNEEDFPLINSTGVWPNWCFIAPFYGKLTSVQVYFPSALLNSVTAVAPSDVVMSPYAKITCTVSTVRRIVYISGNCCATNSDRLTMSDNRCSDSIVTFYQNVRGLRTKYTNFYYSVCVNGPEIICITETWLNDSF